MSKELDVLVTFARQAAAARDLGLSMEQFSELLRDLVHQVEEVEAANHCFRPGPNSSDAQCVLWGELSLQLNLAY